MKRWLKRLRSIQVYFGMEITEEGEEVGWFWYDNGDDLPEFIYSNRVHAWFDAILNNRR